MAKPRVVFAGGGHAHVFSLRRTAEFVAAGFDVTLVSDSPHLHYSSMATGVISGRYSPDEYRLDIRRLTESGGGTFVEARVEHVLPKERILLLEDGNTVPYDAVSFCLGSETNLESMDTANAIPVKPVKNLMKIRAAANGDGASSLLVVGGGAAGCEVAVNAATLMPRGTTTLIEAEGDILSFAPRGARRIMRGHLRSVGVKTMLGAKAAHFEPGAAILADGRKVPADIIVAATGIAPPKLFSRSNLATADDGGMWVNHYLQSITDERIFGGGDSVSFRGSPLPRFGVYAIRQGPVLFRNLRAALERKPLEEFRPQKRFLYILNLGDGTGLGVYGSFAWRSRSVLAVKDFIDRRFMDEYGSQKSAPESRKS